MKRRKAGTKADFEEAEEKHDISNLKSRKIASLKKQNEKKKKITKKLKSTINFHIPPTDKCIVRSKDGKKQKNLTYTKEKSEQNPFKRKRGFWVRTGVPTRLIYNRSPGRKT